MQTKTIEKYFFFGLLLTAFIFTFFIFRPFWVVIVFGASLSIILRPVYNWFLKNKFPSWLSSLLTVILFLIVLCIPLISIGYLVLGQSQDLYHSVISNGNAGSAVSILSNKINHILPEGITFNLNEKITNIISYLTGNLAGIFTTTISMFVSFILTILVIFYFLKDGEEWKKAFFNLSPLSSDDNEKITNKLAKTINGVITGCFFIAISQGLLLGLGYTIFKVPNPALWGSLAGISSLVPAVGTSLISVPAIIFLFITGHTLKAVGLLIWALCINMLLDNFLNPYIIGNRVAIPPFLILFSVLGAISIMGPIGLLVGPLAVSLLYTLISIYRNEYQDNK